MSPSSIEKLKSLRYQNKGSLLYQTFNSCYCNNINNRFMVEILLKYDILITMVLP